MATPILPPSKGILVLRHAYTALKLNSIGGSGLNRLWSQFRDDDAPLALPLYSGVLDPRRWRPAVRA